MSQINGYRLDVESIENKMGIKNAALRLNTLKKNEVLPFDTHGNIRVGIDNYDVLIKVIFQKMLNTESVELNDENEMMEHIFQKINTNCNSELKNIINDLYFKEGYLSSFHPKVFLYQGKVKKSIENIATFFVKTFIDENVTTCVEKIMKTQPEHLLDEIMIGVLPEFKSKKSNSNFDCAALIPEIQASFVEDFEFLSQDEQLFMTSVTKLFKYYLFFYVSQVIMNLKAGFTAETHIYPVHYFVEWEKISKTRPSYVKGWNMIQSKSKDIFAYTNLIQILNQTSDETFNGSFMEIKQALNQLTPEERLIFTDSIDQLIYQIRSIHNMPELNTLVYEDIFGEYECIDRLLTTLHDCKSGGTANRESAFDKYEMGILDIAKGDFLKARGRLGSTLNLTQEWIIFFTKLAIGNNDKIRLNALWNELEKRGLFFDKFTKEEIVLYFEKINVLEKKSDSGDAQYVRIL
ncbi:MAG: DNA phosphorothioation-dependent restriction protein DptG [Candidatus Delongbacteria bacterium]|nr:DNA phosphorothioation-dependent restriction protein DptG [Candidatus Delongbacteria bacterium]